MHDPCVLLDFQSKTPSSKKRKTLTNKCIWSFAVFHTHAVAELCSHKMYTLITGLFKLENIDFTVHGHVCPGLATSQSSNCYGSYAKGGHSYPCIYLTVTDLIKLTAFMTEFLFIRKKSLN